MIIGYARVSKADGSQVLDMQLDELNKAGAKKIYTDEVSGKHTKRPGLDNCLESLRAGDVLMVWKLDRLGRDLKHLINVINQLNEHDIGLQVISGMGSMINTTTAEGKLMFHMFAALAEFERDLIAERTRTGLAAAKLRGKVGGRVAAFDAKQIRMLQTELKNKTTSIKELCEDLDVTKQTIYNYVGPNGELRAAAMKVLEKDGSPKGADHVCQD